jgi:hypothetical protein
MRKVVCHVQSLTQHSSPPPACRPSSNPWEDLPQANRQRLLWLLSQLLQRQLEPNSTAEKEDGDERDESAK